MALMNESISRLFDVTGIGIVKFLGLEYKICIGGLGDDSPLP